MGPDDLGNGSATQDRFAGPAGYRGPGRREPGINPELDPQMPRNGAVPGMEPGVPARMERPPGLPSLDLDGLTEPVFPPAGWSDAATSPTLADHPLLRGLLLELPPRGSVPPPGWLDRWFEAARSILELLYLQDGRRS